MMFQEIWNGLFIITALVLVGFLAWGFIMLLTPLADGLDKLVGVLDRFRRVIFDSQMDSIQVKKSGQLLDLDVEIARAKFEYDQQKALIDLELLQAQIDIMVVERTSQLEKQYGQLMIKSHREQMAKGVNYATPPRNT